MVPMIYVKTPLPAQTQSLPSYEKRSVERLAYSIYETAALLGVSYHTIWRLVKRGKIQAFEGISGKTLITRKELDRFLSGAPLRSLRPSRPPRTSFSRRRPIEPTLRRT